MIIRPETPDDYLEIRELLIRAFAEHPYGHQTEHLIVEALRAAGALTVGLVAELDRVVAGHIVFSPARIDGRDCDYYLLGPVAVLPELQRRGIGKALIEEGLQIIRSLGARGCALVGDPAFYTRFGFRQNPKITLKDIPPQFFMCLTMIEPCPAGELSHHAAFSVSAE